MKAMLAASSIPKLDSLQYPLMASYKLDGIRCLVIDGLPYSRNLKLIPNLHVQKTIADLGLTGLDGELMVEGDFNSVQSAIMSIKGEPNFKFYVFDDFTNIAEPFIERSLKLGRFPKDPDAVVQLVTQIVVDNKEQLQQLLDKAVDKGYEGLIIRKLDAPYKYGRSTPKQGWMSKLKYFYDDEATITAVTELYRNSDTSTNIKDNMIPADTFGAFEVVWNGIKFNVGSGFSNDLRDQLWVKKRELIGKTITFKYQELSSYGVPRFPTFKGFRTHE